MKTSVYVSGTTYIWEVEGNRPADCIQEIQRNGRTVHDEHTEEMFRERFGCTASVREETPEECAARHSKQKLDYLRFYYTRFYEAWKDKSDDRRLFCNIYELLIEAVECMEKVPNNIVWCAFNVKFQDEIAALDKIVHRFTKGECARQNLTDD